MGSILDNPIDYRRIAGALQYQSLTRPDISFSINKLCQFMDAPTDEQMKAMKQLLRYLKNTLDIGLFVSKDSTTALQCFSNSD